MVYKWCIVPQCKNTTKKTPNKLFVSVPSIPRRRKMWLRLAGREPNSIASQTHVFMCEDHFDMEKDVSNYMQYKMGYSQKLLLTGDAMPSKFHCQEVREKRPINSEYSQKLFIKKKRFNIVSKCLQSQDVDSILTNLSENLEKDDFKQDIIDSEDVYSKETVLSDMCNNDYVGSNTSVIDKLEHSSSDKQSNKETDHVMVTENITKMPLKESEKDIIREIVIETLKHEEMLSNLQIGDIIYRVYKYMLEEYETLKWSLPQSGAALDTLSDVMGRTASATGVCKETLRYVLEIKERNKINGTEVVLFEHDYHRKEINRVKKNNKRSHSQSIHRLPKSNLDLGDAQQKSDHHRFQNKPKKNVRRKDMKIQRNMPQSKSNVVPAIQEVQQSPDHNRFKDKEIMEENEVRIKTEYIEEFNITEDNTEEEQFTMKCEVSDEQLNTRSNFTNIITTDVPSPYIKMEPQVICSDVDKPSYFELTITEPGFEEKCINSGSEGIQVKVEREDEEDMDYTSHT